MEGGTTTNSRYIPLHPFDSVYTIAFLYVLVSTFYNIFDATRSYSLEVIVYDIFIFFFFSFLLLRMYYHLKNFEIEISKGGSNHFLEILPSKNQILEKVVRLVLAAVLVFFYYFKISPLHTLLICFSLLIVWDCIVLSGMKSVIPTFINDDVLKQSPSLKSGRSFYYWQDKDLIEGRNYIKHYFGNLKFWERFAGLVATASALAYTETPNSMFIVFLVIAALSSIFIFPLFGKLKIKELYDDVRKEIFGNFTQPLYMPIKILINNLINNKMENSKKQKMWLTIGVVIMIGAISCFVIWKNRDNSPKVVDNVTTIKIATSKNLWCAMTLIALDRNYFEAEGLKPVVYYQAAGRLCMDALVGGSVDFANVVETNIAYQAFNNTTDLKIHSRIVEAADYTILTTQNSKILTPQDFANKRISFAQATGAESFLFWFMEHNNLLDKNLILIPLQPAGLVDNFKGGGSDAVATWEPFVSTIQNQKKDLGELFMADSTGFKGIMTVATKDSWASNNKNIIEAYNRVMEKAATFLKDSTLSAQRILSEQTGIQIETIKNAWERFDYDYTTNLEKEKLLIADVIRRIKMMSADKDKIEQDIENYFK